MTPLTPPNEIGERLRSNESAARLLDIPPDQIYVLALGAPMSAGVEPGLVYEAASDLRWNMSLWNKIKIGIKILAVSIATTFACMILTLLLLDKPVCSDKSWMQAYGPVLSTGILVLAGLMGIKKSIDDNNYFGCYLVMVFGTAIIPEDFTLKWGPGYAPTYAKLLMLAATLAPLLKYLWKVRNSSTEENPVHARAPAPDAETSSSRYVC